MILCATLVLAASVSVTPRVTLYPVPQKRMPTEIVRHGDALWFVAWAKDPKKKEWDGTPKYRGYFGRITMRGRFGKLQPAAEDHMPGLATHTPDGTLWFTDAAQHAFWRVSRDGRIDRVPAFGAALHIAYAGGDLWCTHHLSGWISRHGIDGSSKGGFAVPDVTPPPMTSNVPPLPGPRVASIVAGPDGALWFPESYRNRIGRMTTSGEMTFFALPHRLVDFSEIISAPDGTLWYTTNDAVLGRITTAGEISSIAIGFPPFRITSDSKGRIWYTNGRNTGIIEPDGTRHEFEMPRAQRIRSLIEGPDGAMWFADEGALAIGRVEMVP